jgi:hypothetical protein
MEARSEEKLVMDGFIPVTVKKLSLFGGYKAIFSLDYFWYLTFTESQKRGYIYLKGDRFLEGDFGQNPVW